METSFTSAIEQSQAAAHVAVEDTLAITDPVQAIIALGDEEPGTFLNAPVTVAVEPELPNPQVIEHDDGSMLVCVDEEIYSFHAPRGRDLSRMRKQLRDDMDEVEMLAVAMSVLQDEPRFTADEWLDEVPLHHFQEVGKAISGTFQL